MKVNNMDEYDASSYKSQLGRTQTRGFASVIDHRLSE